VPFETPANIEKWVKERGYKINGTHLYKGDLFPDFSSFDILIVMGGPMGVYDDMKYPFLSKEKVFIENALNLGKKVIGVCLGAQLIADVLGAKVYKNKYKEIGWFPVYKTDEAKNNTAFRNLPDEFIAFHWHGDTFELPSGSIRLAFNEATENQAFQYKDKALALQFHLETNLKSAKDLIDNSQDELKEKGKYIQSPEEILSKREYFKQIEKYLYNVLDEFLLKESNNGKDNK
jgi:GMP synthase (glutamine-hydrolysing)